MDVTHVPSFGRLKYVHVTTDTYSKFIWASAQAGEKALHVIRHLTSAFAVMGVCRQLKTDNGPAYVSQKVQVFLKQRGVKHIISIPHSPTGQAIVEQANGLLKRYLEKYNNIQDPQEKLMKALFVLNYLCVFGTANLPSVIVHFGPKEAKQQTPDVQSGSLPIGPNQRLGRKLNL
ncbi:hypothetical protein DV515_00018806, partial [Chloebia gouldiae]